MGKVLLEDDNVVVWVTVSKNCDFLTLVYGKCYVRSGPIAVLVEDSGELQKLLPRKTKGRYRATALYTLIVLSIAGVLATLLLGYRFFPRHRENSLSRVAEAKKAFDLAVSYEAQGDDEQAISALKDAVERDLWSAKIPYSQKTRPA